MSTISMASRISLSVTRTIELEDTIQNFRIGVNIYGALRLTSQVTG